MNFYRNDLPLIGASPTLTWNLVVVRAWKTTAKSGPPHTTVSLVGWFMRNNTQINYVKFIQVCM